MLSTDIRLALAPATTYRRLIAERIAATWTEVLGQAAFTWLLIGSFVAILAGRRVALGLVLTTAVSWTTAILIQAVAATALILSSRTRSVSPLRACSLLLRAHVPWSAWILTMAAYAVAVDSAVSVDRLLLTALVPVAWTIVILSAFCQTALGTTKRGARVRTVGHQLLIVLLAFLYIAWAAGGWRNVVGSLLR